MLICFKAGPKTGWGGVSFSFPFQTQKRVPKTPTSPISVLSKLGSGLISFWATCEELMYMVLGVICAVVGVVAQTKAVAKAGMCRLSTIKVGGGRDGMVLEDIHFFEARGFLVNFQYDEGLESRQAECNLDIGCGSSMMVWKGCCIH